MDWKLPVNEYTEQAPVTLRGLLSHTAGVTVHGFPGYSPGETLPSLRQILDGESPSNSPPIRVDAIPGRAYRYSGGGYLIVQHQMQDTTGRSFCDLMHEEVLEREQMTSRKLKKTTKSVDRRERTPI